MAITTAQYVASVKRNVTVPNSQIRFSDADILAMGDEQMMILMTPMISSLRQEFFVRLEEEILVNDQSQYKIPYRALGRTLRELKIRDANGTVQYNLPFVVPEDSVNFSNVTGDALGYTIRGDKIVVLPRPVNNPTQYLQKYYELMPSRLIPASEAGVITSVDYNTGIITISAEIEGFVPGQSMDIVDDKSGCSVLALDIVNSNVNGTDITFDPLDFPVAPDTIEPGDYLCISNQTPVLQIPDEAMFVLVQAVSCKILEAQGDFEGLQAAEAKLKENKDALERLLVPRVRSDAPTIVNSNGLLGRPAGANFYRYNFNG